MSDHSRQQYAGNGIQAEASGRFAFRIGEWRVEPELDRLVGESGEVALEPKTMAVLVQLARDPGRVVSAEELIRDVWRGRPMGDNPVYRCIAQLRRALGDDPKAPTHIATVPTKGYRLISPVVAIPATVADSIDQAAVADRPAASSARRTHVAAGSALLVLVAAIGLLAWRPPDGPVGAAVVASQPPALVVAPLRAASSSETDMLLAQAATQLIIDRLGRVARLQVMAVEPEGSGLVTAGGEGSRPGGARGQGQFLLSGDIASADGRLRGHVRLRDSSGTVLWSSAFDKPADGFGGIREEIATGVGGALDVKPEVAATPARAEVDLEAYQLYLRGRHLLDRSDAAGVPQAIEMFRRATILDPGFARGYLGLGQAQAMQSAEGGDAAGALSTMADKAFDRALQLDPTLGEALVGKAVLSDDAARAEALFRAGLRLAPKDGAGRARYAQFLFGQGRIGEAMGTIDQAIRIDPRSPELYLTQASYTMVARSDVAEHDRLVRKALDINPASTAALYKLAFSRWEYRGEFAEAARLLERAIAIDPRDPALRELARDVYLDLGDEDAAKAVLGDAAPPLSRMQLAQYRDDPATAAALLANTSTRDWPDGGPQAAAVQAVRDAALQAGDPASAVRRIDGLRANAGQGVPMWRRGFSLVHAHALSLAGDVEGGRALARDVLHLLDIHGVGRPANWFSRERASAYMVLGDRAQAMQALQHSMENGQVYRWWYLADRDPLFSALRQEPKFVAIGRQVRRHRDLQRALLERMRHAGEVPVRSLAAVTVASSNAIDGAAAPAPHDG